MACKINWAPPALNDYMRVLTYLSSEWGKRAIHSFADRVDRRALSVSFNPGIGRKSERKPDVRRFVISRQNLLYYEVKEDVIQILAVFDTRQNPSKNRFQ